MSYFPLLGVSYQTIQDLPLNTSTPAVASLQHRSPRDTFHTQTIIEGITQDPASQLTDTLESPGSWALWVVFDVVAWGEG